MNKQPHNAKNSYKDLNERIKELRRKSLNNFLIYNKTSRNMNGQRRRLVIMPKNFK